MIRDLIQERIDILKMFVKELNAQGINARFNEETGEIEVDEDAEEIE